ncbi:MAG: prepilin peptidase [Lachnospiraceae bacterium]|nr:prepilin peptidase [Lachnospiraceae bacterium]
MLSVVFYILLFVYAIIIGSFLNVCILRIPLKETIVSKRSHCMKCGHQLAWYDLFPLFSYIFLRGKCRYCKAKISVQYPVIEFTNGALAVLCFMFGDFWPHEIDAIIRLDIFIYSTMVLLLSAVLCSVLIVITLIDWRTFEIPLGANIVILILGLIRLVWNLIVYGKDGNWLEYIIGFFVVSVPLAIIYYISKGRAIGGGDVKLMAAAGLFLGWKLALIALIAGCLYGSIIHIIRMKVSGEGKQLAMGPYLSAGIVTALWFGKYIVEWYSGFFK